MAIDRRQFLTGAAACAAVAVAPAEIALPVEPAPMIWVDVPGTDMAIVGEPRIVAGWFRVFEHGRAAISDERMRELIAAPWEYIVSPNYKGREDIYHLPTLEKWMAANGR